MTDPSLYYSFTRRQFVAASALGVAGALTAGAPVWADSVPVLPETREALVEALVETLGALPAAGVAFDPPAAVRERIAGLYAASDETDRSTLDAQFAAADPDEQLASMGYSARVAALATALQDDATTAPGLLPRGFLAAQSLALVVANAQADEAPAQGSLAHLLLLEAEAA